MEPKVKVISLSNNYKNVRSDFNYLNRDYEQMVQVVFQTPIPGTKKYQSVTRHIPITYLRIFDYDYVDEKGYK